MTLEKLLEKNQTTVGTTYWRPLSVGGKERCGSLQRGSRVISSSSCADLLAHPGQQLADGACSEFLEKDQMGWGF